MPQIQRRAGKTKVKYLLVVSNGKTCDGKQIRHTRTFEPPQTWSEKRQREAAWKAALEFEQKIRAGYKLDNRQTFADYAEYVIATKRRSGTKESTLERYREILQRVNPEIGFMKLVDIRPEHLDRLYEKLAKEGVRKSAVMATPKIDLKSELKRRHITQAALAEKAGITTRVVTQACKAPIIEANAQKISSALGGKTEQFFTLERDNRPLSDKTILEHHRLISAVLAYAEKQMLVPYNAAAKATPPRPKRKEPNYFQPETVNQILDAADTEPLKYRVFLYLCVCTGARRGELAGLKWGNLDIEIGKITIDHALYYSYARGIYEDSTKTGKSRTLIIPHEVRQLLKLLRAEQTRLRLANGDRWTDTGYIFTQDNGQPMNPQTWTGWMDDFSRRHSLPHINPHAFRHTAASVLIANHIDVVTVANQLGHKSSTTTQNYYSHLIEEAQAVAADTLTDVLIRRKA